MLQVIAKSAIVAYTYLGMKKALSQSGNSKGLQFNIYTEGVKKMTFNSLTLALIFKQGLNKRLTIKNGKWFVS